MSKGGSNQVNETPQQRALADFALQQLQDYKQRWLPVQRSLGRQITDMGKPGSAQEKAAEGRAATDSTMQFARAEGALQKTLTDTQFKAGLFAMGQEVSPSQTLSEADKAYKDETAAYQSIAKAIGLNPQ